MADHAASFNPELREMVRRPKAVWPGLLKHNLKQKHIPGDGNCLFASLSDQLYATPDKHPEIRARVIDHMRNFRPLFEHYVQTEDVQTRRALRSTTAAFRQESDDPYADYLTLMSRLGTYGGEPELVAFCQAYDQDVRVHLPRFQSYARENLDYTNEYRTHQTPPPILHVCYGGDEETRAHYDSARSRDGSHPRRQLSPKLEPTDSHSTSLSSGVCSSPTHSLTARAIRNNRSDLSSELFHELHPSENRHSASCLEAFNHRARSSSVSSSHRSSSSKRSLDDDGDNVRSAKRADRRRSRRKRTDLSVVTVEPEQDLSFPVPIDSPHPSTPSSSQDTENSSEGAEAENEEEHDDDDGDFNPRHYEEESDAEIRPTRKRIIKPTSRAAVAIIHKRSPLAPTNLVTMAERPRSTLRA
ncbi:hypothetical protein DV738_g4229, partial [Chaetothyriales sp. CBS 135597]